MIDALQLLFCEQFHKYEVYSKLISRYHAYKLHQSFLLYLRPQVR